LNIGSVGAFCGKGKGDPGTSLASENKKWCAVRTFGRFIPRIQWVKCEPVCEPDTKLVRTQKDKTKEQKNGR